MKPTKPNAAERLHTIQRVSWITVVINLALSLFKLAAGLLAHSSALIADAVHSASDVLTTLAVIVGTRLSAWKADASHEYGHERLECMASLLLAALLAVTGLGIGWSGIRLLTRAGSALPVPGVLALVAALCSVVCKEWMYWYTRAAAKRTGSSALLADAWHHRSDALSSVGSLAGVLGARMGFPLLDPLAAVVICLLILKVSADIFRTAAAQLTDRACPRSVEREMRALVAEQEGVRRLDLLRTRQFGSRYYVDVEIAAEGSLSLYESHAIAQRVHDRMEAAFPQVKHCMVHVNPFAPEGTAPKE